MNETCLEAEYNMREKKEILKSIADQDDRIMVSHMLDKLNRSQNNYMITSCGFYNMRERAILDGILKTCGGKYVFDGGSEDAERTLLLFIPEYYEDMSIDELRKDEAYPAEVIRFDLRYDKRIMSHRDYLGVLMSLGIERSMIGEFWINDSGCTALVMKSVSEHILNSVDKIGNVGVDVYRCGFDRIESVEKRVKQLRDSVPSLRLDSIVAASFGLSRGDAKDAVLKGLVSVNGAECLSPSSDLAEGTYISMRGKGKARLLDASGRTKKGNIAVIIEKYL